MTDYKKLAQALRCKSLSKKCDSCDYGYHLYEDSECNDACNNEMLDSDAADAIEALQAEVKRLQKEVEFSESSYDEFSMQAAVQNALLVGKLPKRGKWIHVEGDEPWQWRCTACHEIAEGHGEFRFCPNCGAKMEVQE